jgi:hypothetical protein
MKVQLPHRIYIDDVIEPLGWRRAMPTKPPGKARRPLDCWTVAKRGGRSVACDPAKLGEVLAMIGGSYETSPSGQYLYIYVPPP